MLGSSVPWCKVPRSRRLTVSKISSETANLLRDTRELLEPAFEYCLVSGQSGLQACRVSSQHPRNLAEAETEFAQGHDFGDAGYARVNAEMRSLTLIADHREVHSTACRDTTR
jgi:hypothetical protein